MNPNNLPVISPSVLRDMECPKRFQQLRMLHRWPESHTPRQVQFAAAFHKTLQQLYLPDNRHGEMVSLESVDQIAHQAFKYSKYEHKSDKEEDVLRCSLMARSYIASDDPEDIAGTMYVEWQDGTDITTENGTRVHLTAKLDRVIVRHDSDPNTLRILDYKTGKPVTDYMEAFVACWVAKRKFPQFKSFVYSYDWIDNTGRATREELHSAELKGYHKILLRKIEWLFADPAFPAVEGEACTFCPLRLSCRSTSVVEYQDVDDVFTEE